MALNILGLPIQLQATSLQVQDLLQGLQPGELLRGRVVELLPQGKAVINLRGQNIVAQLPAPSPGAQAVVKGDILTLQVVSSDPQAAVASQAKPGMAGLPTPLNRASSSSLSANGATAQTATPSSPVLTLRLLPSAPQAQAPSGPATRLQPAAQQLIQALAAANLPANSPALRAASTLSRLGAPLDPATLTHVIKTAEALLAVEAQPSHSADQASRPPRLPESVRQAVLEAVAILKWAGTQGAPGRDVVAVRNALQALENFLQTSQTGVQISQAPTTPPPGSMPSQPFPQGATADPALATAVPSAPAPAVPAAPAAALSSAPSAPVPAGIFRDTLTAPLAPPAVAISVTQGLQALTQAVENLVAGKPGAPVAVTQALQDLGRALQAQTTAAAEPAQLALFSPAPAVEAAAVPQALPGLPPAIVREAASILFFRLAAPLAQKNAVPLTPQALQSLATQVLVDVAQAGSPLQKALLDVHGMPPAPALAGTGQAADLDAPGSLPGNLAPRTMAPILPGPAAPPSEIVQALPTPSQASVFTAPQGRPAVNSAQPLTTQAPSAGGPGLPLAALQQVMRQFSAQPLPASVSNLPALRQVFEERGLPAPQAPLAAMPPESVFEAVAVLQAKGLPLQRPLVEALATQSAAAERAQLPAQRFVAMAPEIPAAFSQLRPELGLAIHAVSQALRESGLDVQNGRLLQQLSHLVEGHGLDLEARLAALVSSEGQDTVASQREALPRTSEPSLKETLLSARAAVHQASSGPEAAASRPLAQTLNRMGAEISQALSTLHAVQVSAHPAPAMDVSTLPLPVWVGGQLEGGQLSVYWRQGKEHKLDEKEPVNVVLALDTRGLGPVRVQLQVWKDSCRCQVRTENAENADFLESGADELRDALNENTPFDLQSLDFGTLSKALQGALGPLGANAPEPRGLSIQA